MSRNIKTIAELSQFMSDNGVYDLRIILRGARYEVTAARNDPASGVVRATTASLSEALEKIASAIDDQ